MIGHQHGLSLCLKRIAMPCGMPTLQVPGVICGVFLAGTSWNICSIWVNFAKYFTNLDLPDTRPFLMGGEFMRIPNLNYIPLGEIHHKTPRNHSPESRFKASGKTSIERMSTFSELQFSSIDDCQNQTCPFSNRTTYGGVSRGSLCIQIA